MPKEGNFMVLEMASRPENVGLARIAVATFAVRLQFTVAEIEEIKVAVSEAVSNAILHGYRSQPEGTVRIETRCTGDMLEVAVDDRGCGIADLEAARQPAYSTDPERTGLGFLFMEQFMDMVEVDTAPGRGTRVRMRRRPRLPGEPAIASGGS